MFWRPRGGGGSTPSVEPWECQEELLLLCKHKRVRIFRKRRNCPTAIHSPVENKWQQRLRGRSARRAVKEGACSRSNTALLHVAFQHLLASVRPFSPGSVNNLGLISEAGSKAHLQETFGPIWSLWSWSCSDEPHNFDVNQPRYGQTNNIQMHIYAREKAAEPGFMYSAALKRCSELRENIEKCKVWKWTGTKPFLHVWLS